MWFKFPPGVEGCSVEQMPFVSEFKDEDGRDWFRAPNHFAPKILGMNLGYAVLPPGEHAPVGCDLEDLAPSAGAVGMQIGEQAQTIASLQTDLGLANEAIQKLESQGRQSESECAILRARNADLEQENTTLRGRLDEFESAQATAEALATKGKK